MRPQTHTPIAIYFIIIKEIVKAYFLYLKILSQFSGNPIFFNSCSFEICGHFPIPSVFGDDDTFRIELMD